MLLCVFILKNANAPKKSPGTVENFRAPCEIYIRDMDFPRAVWYNIAIMGRGIFLWRIRRGGLPKTQWN